MMASIKETLYRLGIDSDTKVAVLTGKDPVRDITTYSLWRNQRNGRNRMTFCSPEICKSMDIVFGFLKY